MDLAQSVDVVLHLDTHLEAVVARFGAWVYAILFTIIVARFLPCVRTFAPFVAGVAVMTSPRFALCNVVGGVLGVEEHFSWVALALIVIPGLPAVIEVLRHTVSRRRGPAA